MGNIPKHTLDKTNNISYSQELLRKAIHICSLLFPVSYIFLDKNTILLVLIPMLALALLIDLLSKFHSTFAQHYFKYFGAMLRPHEKNKAILLNGASWVLISAVLVFALFPKILAITAFSILIISDTMAALIGRRFGKHKLFDKSWEGTFAFILSGTIIVYIYWLIFNLPSTYLIAGILGASTAGFVEAASVSLKMDDNFSIPLSVGLVMYLGGVLASSFGLPFLDALTN